MISLKHRIIGAVFVIAMMVIVIPDMLDDSPSLFLDEVASVPVKPQPPLQNKLTAAPAWSILVGQFDENQAKKWLSTFRRMGWPSYAKAVSDKQQLEVFLGPTLAKDELTSRQHDLQQQFAMTGTIVSYQATAVAAIY